MTGPDGDAVAVLHAALAPYRWRSLTPAMVARIVVAARDRHDLRRVLGTVHGATDGSWGRLVPAAPDDPRLPPVLDLLASHRWTRLQLLALCRHLAALEPTSSRSNPPDGRC